MLLFQNPEMDVAGALREEPAVDVVRLPLVLVDVRQRAPAARDGLLDLSDTGGYGAPRTCPQCSVANGSR